MLECDSKGEVGMWDSEEGVCYSLMVSPHFTPAQEPGYRSSLLLIRRHAEVS